MSPALADSLHDDFTTDGRQLHSEKIQKFGDVLLTLIRIHGMDVPPSSLSRLNGW